MMKNNLRLGLAWGVAALIGTAVCYGEEKVNPLTRKITIKALDSDKGDIGIDYFFQKKLNIKKTGSAQFTAKGFVVADQPENTANALEFLADINWITNQMLPSGWTPPVPPDVDQDKLTPVQLKFYHSQVAAHLNNEFEIRLAATPKYSTTQDFKNHSINVGPSVNVAVPWPILFNNFAGVRSRPFHAGLGYEYIVDQKYDKSTKMSSVEKRKNLAAFDLQTSFDVGDEVQIDVEYRAAYFFKKEIPENSLPRFADFIYVKATFLNFSGMGLASGKLAAVYSIGRLPPLYEKGHSIGSGFFLEF